MQPDLAYLGPSRPAPEAGTPLRVGIAPTPDFTLMSLSCFVEFLRQSADERDHSRQVYCAWDLLSQHRQIVPIPGTRRRERLEENAAATQVALSADEVTDLNNAPARIGVHGNRYNDHHMSLVGR